MPGSTQNSESSTPTEAQVESDRVALQRRLSELQRLTRERTGRIDGDVSEPHASRQIAYEAIAALARAEIVIDMAVDVVRAHTEQLVIENKIKAREIRLQREQVEVDQAGTKRIDKVLDATLELSRKVVTDSRVWTAIGTTVLWFLGQVATSGGGCTIPIP